MYFLSSAVGGGAVVAGGGEGEGISSSALPPGAMVSSPDPSVVCTPTSMGCEFVDGALREYHLNQTPKYFPEIIQKRP